ncbi:hypothetical protein HZS_1120 [Henneguya salminicola]|nr:hypothetical protein HZS_1120 [Henneguya salminicola]
MILSVDDTPSNAAMIFRPSLLKSLYLKNSSISMTSSSNCRLSYLTTISLSYLSNSASCFRGFIANILLFTLLYSC